MYRDGSSKRKTAPKIGITLVALFLVVPNGGADAPDLLEPQEPEAGSEAWFLDRLVAAGFPPDGAYRLSADTTDGERALDDIAALLAERVGRSIGPGILPAPGGGAESDQFYAGEFFLLETYLGSGNPTGACTPGVVMPATAPSPEHFDFAIWPGPPHGWIGSATSDVSDHGAGLLVPVVGAGSLKAYSGTAVYSGSSDFFCVDGRLGPLTFVINAPTVSGTWRI